MSDDFMGGGSYPAVEFKEIGDTAIGIVDKIDKLHDRDPAGNPKFWPNTTDPMYVWPMEFRDPTTGDVRTLWVRGNLVKAIKQAVKEAGLASPQGALLKVRFDALGEKKAGFSQAKLFKVKAEPAPANAAPRKTATVTDEEPW